jgi:hypothetical protein
MSFATVKSEPDVHEPSYDCAVCWLSVLEDLRSGTRVMTCSQCPAQNKVCEACYLHPLSNKSCGQCAGPLREYQHRLSSKSSGADIIDVDAISAASEDLLGHAAPAAATVLKSVRAEETVLPQAPSAKRSRRDSSATADAPIMDVREKMRDDERPHVAVEEPAATPAADTGDDDIGDDDTGDNDIGDDDTPVYMLKHIANQSTSAHSMALLRYLTLHSSANVRDFATWYDARDWANLWRTYNNASSLAQEGDLPRAEQALLTLLCAPAPVGTLFTSLYEAIRFSCRSLSDALTSTATDRQAHILRVQDSFARGLAITARDAALLPLILLPVPSPPSYVRAPESVGNNGDAT